MVISHLELGGWEAVDRKQSKGFRAGVNTTWYEVQGVGSKRTYCFQLSLGISKISTRHSSCLPEPVYWLKFSHPPYHRLATLTHLRATTASQNSIQQVRLLMDARENCSNITSFKLIEPRTLHLTSELQRQFCQYWRWCPNNRIIPICSQMWFWVTLEHQPWYYCLHWALDWYAFATPTPQMLQISEC